jgi:nitroreductase
MDVIDALEKRRALRSLAPFEVTKELVDDLVGAAHLAPSCMNNQSWRFVAIYEPEMKARFDEEVLSRGNAWAIDGSLYFVVFSKKDDDCTLKGERDYFLFDTGMATAYLMLRATELDLIAHPIAGYDPDKAKEVLGIPDEYVAIAMVIVGKLADGISPRLKEWQVERETGGRQRRPLETVLHHNMYHPEQEPSKE